MVQNAARFRPSKGTRGRGEYEEYHPYGTCAWWAGDADVVSQRRYRYTGMERDEETGLAVHGVRYYAAWLGRWGSVDPAGLAGGINAFCYCIGAPISMSDTDGRAPKHTSDHVAGFTAADILALEHVLGPMTADAWPVGPFSGVDLSQWNDAKATIGAFADLSRRGLPSAGIPNLTSMEMALGYAAGEGGRRPATLVVPEGQQEWLHAKSASGSKYKSEHIGTRNSGNPVASGTGLWVSYGTTNDCMNNCTVGLAQAGRPSVKGGSRVPRTGSVSETAMGLVPAARNDGKLFAFGMSQMSATDASSILDYIDDRLAKGLPVVVGVQTGQVNVRGSKGFNEGVTDHFLIIYERGYTDSGEVFYSFVDNASSGRGQYGRFFVNPMEGILFKEAVTPEDGDVLNETFLKPYTTTQAR